MRRLVYLVGIIGLFWCGNIFAGGCESTPVNFCSQHFLDFIKGQTGDPEIKKIINMSDKMVAMVDDAVKYATKEGKQKALKTFMDKTPNTRFQQGELYLYTYDFKGTVISHGAKPHLVGKNIWKLQDKRGKLLIQALTKCAENKNGGYVLYYWPHPQKPSQILMKLGFVKPVIAKGKPENYWTGSGIYLNSKTESEFKKYLAKKNLSFEKKCK